MSVEADEIYNLMSEYEEAKRKFLEPIRSHLVRLGFSVRWSTIGVPALIVNEKCQLTKYGDRGLLLAKFWYQEDERVKQDLQNVYGNRIVFSESVFTMGSPTSSL